MNTLTIDPRELKSDLDLHVYLVWLAGQLELNGECALSGSIESASKFASGSASEFLHQAQEALMEVERNSISLRDIHRDDLSAVIAQVDEAFQKVGGA